MAVAFAGPLSKWFAGARGDATRLAGGVAAWRADLQSAVATKVGEQLTWDEAAPVAAETDLGEAGWLAVRLLGLYADRPELDWPDRVPPLLELDPQWRAAADAKFDRSRYGHLLACSVWLPGDFPVTFRVPLPDGSTAEIGSTRLLADQLGWLNQRTFQADGGEVAGWAGLPAAAGGEFVAAARRGYAGLRTAVDAAVRGGVPLVVGEARPAGA